MHARSTRIDHHFLQLERVQIPAKACFRIRHNRLEPIPRGFAGFAHFNLIRTLQRRVDAPHHGWHRIRRVKRLVGVHHAREVRIRRHLPARKVNRLQPRAHLLHGLIAGERTQRIHIRLAREIIPQLLGCVLGNAIFNRQAAAQLHHIGPAIGALYASPAFVFFPVFF